MKPEDVEKLLGGYATGTLTEAERQALFAVALDNQTLFDALANEQALKELCDDPAARAQLLAALAERPQSLLQQMTAWMRRPSVIALAGAAAAGVLIVALVSHTPRALRRAPMMTASAPPPETVPRLAVPAPQAAAPAERKAAPKRKAEKASKPAVDLLARREQRAVAPAAVAENAPAPRRDATSGAVGGVIGGVPAQVAGAPPPPPPAAVTAFRAGLRSTPSPSARDLYYAPAAAMMDMRVEREQAAKARAYTAAPAARTGPAVQRAPGVRYSVLKLGVDGAYAEVDPAAVFQPGDDVRLRFEANEPGNLAVFQRDGAGNWSLRLPARTQPGQPVYLPAESSLTLRAPGELRLFVTFSRQQEPPAGLREATATPNLLYEKADRSTYVVNPARRPDAGVSFEITLNWK